MSNEEARCRRAWVYAEEMRVKVREASGRQPFRRFQSTSESSLTTGTAMTQSYFYYR